MTHLRPKAAHESLLQHPQPHARRHERAAGAARALLSVPQRCVPHCGPVPAMSGAAIPHLLAGWQMLHWPRRAAPAGQRGSEAPEIGKTTQG